MANEIENEKIVSVVDFNKVLNLTPNEENLLEINFLNEIKKFDIVFIAGLILLHKTKNRKFDIKCKETVERIFETRQSLRHCEVLFNIKFNEVFQSFGDIRNLGPGDDVASKSFAPVLYINTETIKQFFDKCENLPSEIDKLREKYSMHPTASRNQNESDYLDSEESIFKKINNYSAIHAFIFFILYNKISPFVNPKSKGIESSIKRTNELWEFTQEYIVGLKELAKNIVEHSGENNSDGQGMITIRVYNEDEEKINPGKVLETHVFDFGKLGIIEKLKEFSNSNERENNLLSDDLRTLNDNFRLKDFIKPSMEKQLYQQLYRDIAHFGLMKFYQLIEKNQGSILSGTIGENNKIDVYTNLELEDSIPIATGTSYFFKLPFKPELFRPIDITQSVESYHGTPYTINGLAEILNFEFKTSPDVINSKSIYNINFPAQKIENRIDENKLIDLLENTSPEFQYLSINMSGIKLSSSSLLRFFAYISKNYNQSIIIYNVDYEVYSKMINDNEVFYENVAIYNDKVPYWYENKSLLVFTRIIENQFYFADLLFGRNKGEFETINRIIFNTFPNSLSITKNILIDENFQIPPSLNKFFHQSSLLPFDILLNGYKDISIFQTNLRSLLNSGIKKSEYE